MESNRVLLSKSYNNLKKNYLLFVFVCLIIAVIGLDFEGTTGGITGQYSDFDINIFEDDNSNLQDVNIFDNEEYFGKTNGVFASVVDIVGGDDVIEKIFEAIGNMISKKTFSISIKILLSIIVLMLIHFLIYEPSMVSVKRIVLENRTYEKTKAERLFFLFRNNKWFNTSWVMLVTQVRLFLWSLTIVGFFIKRYSYYMVPYILAENPDIKPGDAIDLSRKMMNGHKFECFVKEMVFSLPEFLSLLPAVPFLSFLKIDIVLAIYAFIFSIIFILLINPLRLNFFTEYYVEVRNNYLKSNSTEGIFVADRYLYEKPDSELRIAQYQDINETKEFLSQPPIPQTGLSGFIANNFSVVLVQNEASENYEKRKIAEYKLAVMGDDEEGISYPDRLHPAWKKNGFKFVDKMQFDRQYSLTNIVLMFFVVSFCGWLWEVSLHLVQAGEIVNRGTLYGPWLPIYGSGGILVLMLLTRLRKHPVITFIVTIILCGILEYTTSVILELVHGARWWDYSGYFMNLHGRICGEGLLIFGIGGIVFIYICAPLLDNLLNKYSHKLMKVLAIILAVIFVSDGIYSAGTPNAGEGVVENNISKTNS